MAMHTRRNIAALSWLALTGASASGQTADLDIVDERIEDVSPLAVSLRDSRPSLRQPADFGRVYRFQDDSHRLARAQGALYAVFARSVYAVDKDGNVFPIVPPGTVYYIGQPSGFAASAPPRAAAGRNRAPTNRIDGRIETKVAPRVVAGMVVDPEVRTRRSFRPPADRRRRQSIPGTPATGPGTPSGD